jgi:uncharacterized protein YeaC (DUF1315 family)
VDIRWVNRGLVAVRVGKWPRKKTLHVGGEALLAHDPDYLIYARSITHWEDGTPISDEEKAGCCCVPSARGMLKHRSSPNQIAKASWSNATATRRLAGSSTASS